MPTYATSDDFETYTGLELDDEDAVTRLLEFSERDVDTILRATSRDQDTGLKLTVANLTDFQAAALMRATCAQAEYRYLKGEDFFVNAQHAVESGPDFRTEGKLPYIGPKVHRELVDTGLARGRVHNVPLVGAHAPVAAEPDRLDFPFNSGGRLP